MSRAYTIVVVDEQDRPHWLSISELNKILEPHGLSVDAVAMGDRLDMAHCPVLTVTAATTNDGATLNGDRDAQRRAAELLHQDVRLVPVR